jgi:TP901-1 family phage major tail protein
MAAQKGSAMLLKIGTTAADASTDAYTTVGGLRTTGITHNDEAVDVTTIDSAGVRELIAQGGIRSVSISGSGVFTDATSETTLKDAFGAASFSNYEVVIPDFGSYKGKFMVASLAYSGEYNGTVSYDVTLESSGTIAFS